MTTIAWDGRTLAADRRATSGGTATITPRPKIERVIGPDGRVVLMGFAGPAWAQNAYLSWLAGGPELTWPSGDESCTILMFDRRGRIFKRSRTEHWVELRAKIWATGSGCDYALGAMLAGASAVEAVRIAAKLDIYTGGPVDSLEFE